MVDEAGSTDDEDDDRHREDDGSEKGDSRFVLIGLFIGIVTSHQKNLAVLIISKRIVASRIFKLTCSQKSSRS